MAVDTPGGDDQMFAGDHLRACAHDQGRIDARHRVWIARLADLDNTPVSDTDVPFDNAPVVNNDRVGNHQIERASDASAAVSRGRTALPHTITDDFAAAEGDFIAVSGEVMFDLDNQFGVGQPQPVTGGRAIQISIGAARKLDAHVENASTRANA